MKAFLFLVTVAIGYSALTVWAAHVYRSFRRKKYSIFGSLLAVPVVAVVVSTFLPEKVWLLAASLIIGFGAFAIARFMSPAEPIIPRRETKPAILQLVLISSSAVFLIPFVWLVSTSLKTDLQMSAYPPVWIPHPTLWKNYPDALKFLPAGSDYGLVPLWNSLTYAVLAVIGTVLSSSLVAYGFARLRWPGRDIVFGLVLSTMMLPGAVTMMPQFLIFRQLHWIDTLLPLWVPSFFAGAFNVFLLRQFFLSIPNELEDAAKMDGCSYLGTWWYVMMPMVRPALAAVAIMTFLGAWKDFMGPLIYISSPDKMPVAYALQLYNSVHGDEPGLLMAATTLVLLPVMILFFFTQRYFVEGVTLTGLGGR
jgi:ABC-type glycerol-3-phosphate transport system permease component